jgi:hypothetical protein
LEQSFSAFVCVNRSNFRTIVFHFGTAALDDGLKSALTDWNFASKQEGSWMVDLSYNQKSYLLLSSIQGTLLFKRQTLSPSSLVRSKFTVFLLVRRIYDAETGTLCRLSRIEVQKYQAPLRRMYRDSKKWYCFNCSAVTRFVNGLRIRNVWFQQDVAEILTQKNTTWKDYQTSNTQNQSGETKICCDMVKFVVTCVS